MIGCADDPRLDYAVYAALTGAQARFAAVRGGACRFAVDVAPFLAVPRQPSAQDWLDAAELVPVGSYRAGYCRTVIACRCVTTRLPVLRTCPAAFRLLEQR